MLASGSDGWRCALGVVKSHQRERGDLGKACRVGGDEGPGRALGSTDILGSRHKRVAGGGESMAGRGEAGQVPGDFCQSDFSRVMGIEGRGQWARKRR